jgi:hypothetical protein
LKRLKEEICSTARRRSPERAETRGGFGLERVVSCRSRDPKWRTKLNFRRGEPFDDLHRATTHGTAPKIGEVFGGGSVLFGLRLWYRAEQLKAKRQKSEEWHAGGWPGIRSYGCARNLPEVGATGSCARTHRQVGSATSVCCGLRNRGSEK